MPSFLSLSSFLSYHSLFFILFFPTSCSSSCFPLTFFPFLPISYFPFPSPPWLIHSSFLFTLPPFHFNFFKYFFQYFLSASTLPYHFIIFDFSFASTLFPLPYFFTLLVILTFLFSSSWIVLPCVSYLLTHFLTSYSLFVILSFVSFFVFLSLHFLLRLWTQNSYWKGFFNC